MRVYPPLLACARYAVKLFGLVSALLVVLTGVANVAKHRPFMASLGNDLPILLAVWLVVTAVLVAVVYVGARVWAWSFDHNGIKGRSYWGHRVAMKWHEVERVANTSVEGIPALLISSSNGKSKIFAYTLGVSITSIYAKLQQYAGPDHVLTQAFKPRAA